MKSPDSVLSFRRLLMAAALLAAALLAWWWWTHKTSGGPKRPPGGPVPVRAAEARSGDFPIELKALGTVSAYNTVNVRPRVSGQLVKVLFEEGREVKSGDLLAVIDPRPFEIALARAEGVLQENRAQLRNAELDLKRYEGLYAKESIARQRLDTQKALVAQLQGTLKTNEAALRDARLNLEYTQVRAPISGRLGLRQVDLGNLVASADSTPLVTITQTQPIAVEFTLPEGELPAVLKRLRAGAKLGVEAWDRSERNRLAEGWLQSLDNQIDPATGTLRLKGRFDNNGHILFPNQFVNVRLRVDTREGAVLIPSAALQFGAKGTFVYVVGADGKVALRRVTAGPGNGPTTVIEEGLTAGEQVVLEGIDRLRDGAKVEVIGEAAAGAATPVRAPAPAKPKA